MRRLRFDRLRTILCLGAHSDDIEIGAGATLLRLVRENPEAQVVWVVCSATGVRASEAEASSARFLEGAGAAEIVLRDFRDGHFPGQMSEVKAFFEDLKRCNPDLILTHFGQDLHQDHRVVSELTWNTFRDHAILEYEIPKWDGGLGSPNFFVPAAVADTDRKIELLTSCFASQAAKHWFDDLTFRGLMRLRGLECNAPEPRGGLLCTEAPAGMRMPLVSIGMQVINGERFLRQAIESILAQDFPNLELIVSDNASTDATPETTRPNWSWLLPDGRGSRGDRPLQSRGHTSRGSG